ncbi:MAG: hypothetical protein HYT98_04255 [Candidatus Sungbacteria bacterium]|nr:hypothetical protein [Candidatus Sungbacteria bacterium]
MKSMDKKIKSFHNFTLRDPLFAAEGLDIDNAKWALEELEFLTREVERVWRPSHRWFCFWHPFTETLHPIGFLKRFLESERQRRRFIISPSEKNAELLLRTHEKTVSALELNLTAYRDSILDLCRQEHIPPDTSIFYFHTNSISLAEFLKSIEVIYSNLKELKKEVKRRRNIFERGDFKSINFSDAQPPGADPIPWKIQGPSLSEKYQEILRLEEKHISGLVEKYGPIFYEFAHLDGTPRIHNFFTYVTRDNRNRRSFHISLADCRFFLELTKTESALPAAQSPFDNRTRAIYEPSLKRGVRYWHQDVTSFYSVLDLRYYADLATLTDLNWRRTFLDHQAVLSQKSSMLDLILWTGVQHERSYMVMSKVQARAGQNPSPLYNFIARSYPSLYYLTFNRSVWRISDAPRFLGSRFGNGGIYKTLEEIEPFVSSEILEKIFESKKYRHMDWKQLY